MWGRTGPGQEKKNRRSNRAMLRKILYGPGLEIFKNMQISDYYPCIGYIIHSVVASRCSVHIRIQYYILLAVATTNIASHIYILYGASIYFYILKCIFHCTWPVHSRISPSGHHRRVVYILYVHINRYWNEIFKVLFSFLWAVALIWMRLQKNTIFFLLNSRFHCAALFIVSLSTHIININVCLLYSKV